MEADLGIKVRKLSRGATSSHFGLLRGSLSDRGISQAGLIIIVHNVDD